MNRDSKYYNPNWPEYTCKKCGSMFQFKFGKSEYCSTCMLPTHKKLKSGGELVSENNIRFKENHKPKKRR